jgi:hypothetical protein
MKKVLAISSVLLGVAFLAGCGQQPVSQTQPTTPAPVAQAPITPAVTQNYIEVKELGFKIPVSSEMSQKITYGIGFRDKFNDFSSKAYFSTKELSKYKGCAEWPGVFTVEKISGKPTDDKNKVFEIGGGNKKIVLDGVIKQFDGFFLFANNTTQSSCSDMKALDAEGALIDVIKEGLKNAVLITK